MSITIRNATPADAPAWLELLKAVVGADYPAQQIYSLRWAEGQLSGPQGAETWLAEVDGKLRGSVSILLPYQPNENPVANIGRHLELPDNYQNGVAEALIRRINEVCADRRQMALVRVLASDHAQQILLEKLGYACVGYQPCKHVMKSREGALFYARIGAPDLANRLPFSWSLEQVNDLATAVLKNLAIAIPECVRNGVTGYPLQTELQIHEATHQDFDACKISAQSANPPVEISGQFNRGLGMFRVPGDADVRVLIGRREGRIVAGLCFYLDTLDHCVRMVDSFAIDDLSMGGMFQRAIKVSQEQMNAVYVETDFLMSAPRLLKSAEQLGFVPVAYFPGFFNDGGHGTDVVKMVKLNTAYALDNVTFTPHARSMAVIVDQIFQSQKVGVAIVNLLRGLSFFDGLGDGELRKMAGLFTQKLFKPGEKIFSLGDKGDAAYVVMRGQINICLKEDEPPIATIANGAIFGEQAFLDDSKRSASAIATQPSILLMIQRSAFSVLAQTEPHLGLVVMRNMAIELSSKLRRANAAMAAGKR